MHNYEKLMVWQKGMELTLLVYTLTGTFPASEQFGLTSQMKRAAVSIPSNIAEGSRRNTKRDFCHFLDIALGSASELDTQLRLAQNFCFGPHGDYDKIMSLLSEIMRMLQSLIKKQGR